MSHIHSVICDVCQMPIAGAYVRLESKRAFTVTEMDVCAPCLPKAAEIVAARVQAMERATEARR